MCCFDMAAGMGISYALSSLTTGYFFVVVVGIFLILVTACMDPQYPHSINFGM